jgi:hypothetical protein
MSLPGSALNLLESPDPYLADTRPNNVIHRELDNRHRKQPGLDQVNDRAKARGLLEITLANIPVDDHGAMLPG